MLVKIQDNDSSLSPKRLLSLLMDENRCTVIERIMEKDCCCNDEKELLDAFLKMIMKFEITPARLDHHKPRQTTQKLERS